MHGEVDRRIEVRSLAWETGMGCFGASLQNAAESPRQPFTDFFISRNTTAGDILLGLLVHNKLLTSVQRNANKNGIKITKSKQDARIS